MFVGRWNGINLNQTGAPLPLPNTVICRSTVNDEPERQVL